MLMNEIYLRTFVKPTHILVLSLTTSIFVLVLDKITICTQLRKHSDINKKKKKKDKTKCFSFLLKKNITLTLV